MSAKSYETGCKVLDTIYDITAHLNLYRSSACLVLPPEAWDEPCLLSACPYCHKPAKFNPFVVDNRNAYADIDMSEEHEELEPPRGFLPMLRRFFKRISHP